MDFVESFLTHTKDVNSPEIFRLWSAIAAVGAAMERRCWTKNKKGILFPNLSVLLVASPGIGKTEGIKRIEKILKDSKKVVVMPKSLTSASLVDVLKRATKTYLSVGGTPVEYHSGMILTSELGTMISAHDLEFLSLLNEIYDSPDVYAQQRRHFNEGKEVQILNPQLNILAGTQPAFLAHLLPEEAWSMGATSRMILVYAGQFHDDSDVFGDLEEEEFSDRAALTARLGFFGEQSGQFLWMPDAMEMFNRWKKSKYAPVPEHSKLQHYLPRRGIHAIKLAMISAMSATGELTVRQEDFVRALDWLLAAERIMPDIFREMAGKSDSDVLMELHYFMWQIMVQRKAKAQAANLGEGELYNFLRLRVPGEKIGRILEVAERSRIISRDPLDPAKWIARPKHQHGVE